MQTDVLLVLTAAFGTLQGGFRSLGERKLLPCPFTMDQAGLADFLACLVSARSRMAAGNAKGIIIKQMGGRKPILTTVIGNMPSFDKVTVVGVFRFVCMEFLHMFTGLARQITTQSE